VASWRPAELPSVDLGDEQIKRFFYCGSADAPAALVGLEIYGDSALLRSFGREVGRPFLRSRIRASNPCGAARSSKWRAHAIFADHYRGGVFRAVGL